MSSTAPRPDWVRTSCTSAGSRGARGSAQRWAIWSSSPTSSGASASRPSGGRLRPGILGAPWRRTWRYTGSAQRWGSVARAPGRTKPSATASPESSSGVIPLTNTWRPSPKGPSRPTSATPVRLGWMASSTTCSISSVVRSRSDADPARSYPVSTRSSRKADWRRVWSAAVSAALRPRRCRVSRSNAVCPLADGLNSARSMAMPRASATASRSRSEPEARGAVRGSSLRAISCTRSVATKLAASSSRSEMDARMRSTSPGPEHASCWRSVCLFLADIARPPVNAVPAARLRKERPMIRRVEGPVPGGPRAWKQLTRLGLRHTLR